MGTGINPDAGPVLQRIIREMEQWQDLATRFHSSTRDWEPEDRAKVQRIKALTPALWRARRQEICYQRYGDPQQIGDGGAPQPPSSSSPQSGGKHYRINIERWRQKRKEERHGSGGSAGRVDPSHHR